MNWDELKEIFTNNCCLWYEQEQSLKINSCYGITTITRDGEVLVKGVEITNLEDPPKLIISEQKEVNISNEEIKAIVTNNYNFLEELGYKKKESHLYTITKGDIFVQINSYSQGNPIYLMHGNAKTGVFSHSLNLDLELLQTLVNYREGVD